MTKNVVREMNSFVNHQGFIVYTVYQRYYDSPPEMQLPSSVLANRRDCHYYVLILFKTNYAMTQVMHIIKEWLCRDVFDSM